MFILFLVFAVLVGMHQAQGQVFQGGANLFVGIPQGGFRDNVDRAGIGSALYAGLAPKEYAYMLGVELGFMNYGTEKRREAGRVVYDVRKSKTDLLSVQVGVAVRF